MKKVTKLKLQSKIIVIGLILIIIIASFASNADENISKFTPNNLINDYKVNDALEKSDSWPLAHHDAKGTRCSLSTAPSSAYVKWKYYTGESFRQTTPIIADNKLFIGYYATASDTGGVVCLNTETGDKIWEYITGEVLYPVAYDSNKIIVVAKMGTYPVNASVICLDSSSGSQIWNKTYHKSTGSTPVISDGKVYVPTSDYQGTNNITCFDLNTGSEIWRYSPAPYTWIHSDAISINNGKIYLTIRDISTNTRYLVCIDATSTSEIWRKTIQFTDQSTPVLDNGCVYIVTLDGQDKNEIFCYDANNGAKIWSNKFDSDLYFYSTPALWNDSILLVGEHINYEYSKVFSIDQENGHVQWSKQISEVSETSSPSVSSDGKIIFGTDPLVQCWDAITGEIIWTFELDFTGVYNSAAIAYGNVFFPDYNGDIIAFGENQAPENPTITGEINGVAGENYEYTFCAVDPNGDDIFYYIDWGDGEIEEWIGGYFSGEDVILNHSWVEEGTYTIKAKAKDYYDAESDWTTLEITMPVNYQIFSNPILKILINRFPNAFLLMRLLFV